MATLPDDLVASPTFKSLKAATTAVNALGAVINALLDAQRAAAAPPAPTSVSPAPAPVPAPDPTPAPTPAPVPLTDGPATLPTVVQIIASYAEPRNPVRTTDATEAQAALDAGRDVLIPPGATMLGRLTFSPSSRDATIRTDRPCPVAPGTRATPQNLVGAARILAPDAQGAITVLPGAQRPTLHDLDMQPAPGVSAGYWLVNQAAGGPDEPESQGLLLDRVLVRAAVDLIARPPALFRRGVAANGGSLEVRDSFVAGFHSTDSDSQAVCGWAGGGSLRVVNCFLSAGSEPFAVGGAGPSQRGRYPRRIQLLDSHVWKGLTGVWQIGGPLYLGQNKNLWEIKTGGEVEIARSVFENQPEGDNSQRFAGVPKHAPYEDELQDALDITGHHCLYLNCGGGYGLIAHEGYPSQHVDNALVPAGLRRVSFHDDVWLGRPRTRGGGSMFGFLATTQPTRTMEDVDIRHITAVAGNSAADVAALVITDPSTQLRNVVIRDSVLPNERYGLLQAQAQLAAGTLRVVSNLIHDEPGAYGAKDRVAFPAHYDPSNVGVDNLAIDAVGRISDADAAKVRTTDGRRVGADLDVDALMRAVRSAVVAG